MSMTIWATLMLVAIVVIIEDDRIKHLEHDMNNVRTLYKDQLAEIEEKRKEAKK